MVTSTSLTNEDIQLYATQMENIKTRLSAAEYFFSHQANHPFVEAGILQLRLALETLAMSSLVSNRSAIQAVSTAFARKDHGDALKLVREVNPAFWPQPVEERTDEVGIRRWVDAPSGWLTEGEYLPTWGRLSSWLHASNPFKDQPSAEDGASLGIEVIRRLMPLLNLHLVNLAERDEVLACIMAEASTGNVSVSLFGSLDR